MTETQPNKNSKIKKKNKIYLIFFFLLTLLIIYLLALKISSNIVKNIIPKIISKFEEKTDRKVFISSFKVSLNSLYLDDLKITEPKSNQIFFQAKKIEIDYDPYIILTTQKIFLDKIKIDGLKLNLKKQEENLNFTDILNLFQEKDEPIYKRYFLKDLEITNSELLFKENKNEFLFNNINIQLNHIINLPFFGLEGSFEVIAIFKDIITNGDFYFNTKIKFTDFLEEIKGDIIIKKLKIDKVFITTLNSNLKYKKQEMLEIKTDISQIDGFSDYEIFKKIENNYTKIFSKKINSSISFINLKLNLSKNKSVLFLNSDFSKLESLIDFQEQNHSFNLNLFEVRFKSYSKISKPTIISNSSETLNLVIKEFIKKVEHILIKLKEDI